MERLKDFLVVAPFFALSIAVTYLQGYWSAFDILPFPYLTFQELLTYSATPLFGYLLINSIGLLAGMLSGANSTSTHSKKQRSRFVEFIFDIFIFILVFGIIYFKVPYRWVFAPIFLLGLFLPWILRWEPLQKLREIYPFIHTVSFILIWILVGSFGYGRSLAEELQFMPEPNASITWDTNIEESVRLIGRLGSHYFYLDKENLVNVREEQYVKRIKYFKIKDRRLITRKEDQD